MKDGYSAVFHGCTLVAVVAVVVVVVVVVAVAVTVPQLHTTTFTLTKYAQRDQSRIPGAY